MEIREGIERLRALPLSAQPFRNLWLCFLRRRVQNLLGQMIGNGIHLFKVYMRVIKRLQLVMVRLGLGKTRHGFLFQCGDHFAGKRMRGRLSR